MGWGLECGTGGQDPGSSWGQAEKGWIAFRQGLRWGRQHLGQPFRKVNVHLGTPNVLQWSFARRWDMWGGETETRVDAEKDPGPREGRGAEQKNLEHGTGCAGKIWRMRKTGLGRA